MERTELIRERHRPDWLAILLGITGTFAVMGAMSILGGAFRLLSIHPVDSVPEIVFKLLWLLTSVCVANYAGGFVMGFFMPARSRIAAAVNGLIVVQISILIYASIALFGYLPLPGLVYTRDLSARSSDALVWWAAMVTLPAFFAAAFGAMSGNDLSRGPKLDKVEDVPSDQPHENKRRDQVGRAA